ncbi:MAG: hypothetical protein ACLR5S_08840 [Ruminococcus sp.]
MEELIDEQNAKSEGQHDDFLCGFMGCGKTTVGEILAKSWGCR